MCRSSPKCFLEGDRHGHMASAPLLPGILLGSELSKFARTGIWGGVLRRLAKVGGSMASAASVGISTKQKTSPPAPINSGQGDPLSTNSFPSPRAGLGRTKSLKHSRGGRFVPYSLDLPRFKRRFAWTESDFSFSPSAKFTETAPPLPSPPLHLLQSPILQQTIRAYGDQIQVSTPFDVDRFENLLSAHPNRPFVDSVIKGLREGFWPLDEGDWDLNQTDFFESYPEDAVNEEEIRKFKDREVNAGRWSGEVELLLPGTKVSPLFVIWQNSKPRVVTDHTASGLNQGIPREEAKVRYDDMRSFGQVLHNARKRYPGRRLTTYKSDVAKAFLNLPAHPLWQIRQLVCVDGKFHIVRRLVFGNRASPRIWCAVSSLLCWLAERLGIEGLNVYMDDFFGWDFADNLIRFHGKLLPRRQVQLLILWNHVRCPYDDEKQLEGCPLKIIGFLIDINAGSISLSADSIIDILSGIDKFLSFPGRNPSLRAWLRLAGHLNWMLNVLPWGRPALTEIYRKISGKSLMSSGVFINNEVRADLLWLKETIPESIGIRFVDSGIWDDIDADMVIWTDASPKGALAFVYAGNGFFAPIPSSCRHPESLFLELMAILSAVDHASKFDHPPLRLLLWTDSLDSVSMFNSLRANEPIHNGPLLGVASVILRSGIDLRVHHIPGKQNIAADMLSRLLFEDFASSYPSYRVREFTPPRDLLPARWREQF